MGTAVVTHASQLRDPSLVYCDRDQVLQLVEGINKGTDGLALSNLGAEAIRNAFIDAWLPVATQKVYDVAKRDFGYYEDQVITFSGTNVDRVDLGLYGLKPLVEVSKLIVDDYELDETAYYCTGDGWLIFSGDIDYTNAYPPRPRGTKLFTQGFLNVQVTATWGYETVPDHIQMACALFAVAYIIPFAETFDSNVDDDTPGGDISIQMGDMRVTQKGGESRYGRFVKQCYQAAKSLCTTAAPRVRMALVTPERA